MMRSSVVLPQPDGPRKHIELAALDAKRDALERREATEALADPGQFEKGSACLGHVMPSGVIDAKRAPGSAGRPAAHAVTLASDLAS